MLLISISSGIRWTTPSGEPDFDKARNSRVPPFPFPEIHKLGWCPHLDDAFASCLILQCWPEPDITLSSAETLSHSPVWLYLSAGPCRLQSATGALWKGSATYALWFPWTRLPARRAMEVSELPMAYGSVANRCQLPGHSSSGSQLKKHWRRSEPRGPYERPHDGLQ